MASRWVLPSVFLRMMSFWVSGSQRARVTGADETLAMIDQQPQIELRARQRRGRQGLDPGRQ